MRALADSEETVFAITGAASLFGFTRISQVLPMVEPHVQGRLLVFFPGTYENNNYHLLDARRDGWNYLAVPITTQEGELRGLSTETSTRRTPTRTACSTRESPRSPAG